MGRPSAMAVKAATRPGRLDDGDGLFLVVQPGGSKSWMVRVQKRGSRRDFGLGSALKVSLALARERAREVRAWMELGLDPVFERKKAQGIPTFREATAKALAQHRKTWRNAKELEIVKLGCSTLVLTESLKNLIERRRHPLGDGVASAAA